MGSIRRKIPEDLQARMEALLKQCRNERETRRVQVILLLAKHRWDYAQIAAATGYAPTTVRDLQMKFFRDGESALLRRQKPRERNQHLSREEEARFLERFLQSADEGELVTIADIRQALEKQLGKKVAHTVPYRLLQRHGWRKLKPRPKHPRSDPAERERFKKNPTNASGLTSKSQAHWAPPAGDVPG